MKKYSNDFVALSAIIGWAIFFVLPYFDISGADMGFYTSIAASVGNGNFLIANKFWLRIGVWGPLAIAMFIGVPVKYLVWVTVIEFIGLLTLVYVQGRLLGNRTVAFMAAAFICCASTFLASAGVVMGDIVVALTANLAVTVYLFFYLEKEQLRLHPVRWGILFSVIAVLAFFTKESAGFFIPLVLFCAFKDRKNIVLKRFWTSSMFTMIGCIIICGIIFSILPIMGKEDVTRGNPFAIIGMYIDGGRFHPQDNIPTYSKIFSGITDTIRMFASRPETALIGIMALIVLLKPTKTGSEILVKRYLGLILAGFMMLLVLPGAIYGETVHLDLRVWLEALLPMVIGSMLWLGTMKRFKRLLFCGILYLPFKQSFETSYIAFSERTVFQTYTMHQEVITTVDALHPAVVLASSDISHFYGMYTDFKKKLGYIDHNDVVSPGSNTALLTDGNTQCLIKNGNPSDYPAYLRNPEKHGFRLIKQWPKIGTRLYSNKITTTASLKK